MKKRSRGNGQARRLWLIWGSVLVVVCAASPVLLGHWLLNRGALTTLQSLLGRPELNRVAEEQLNTALLWQKPQVYWLLGRLAEQRQDAAARQHALVALIAEQPKRLPLLRIVAAGDEALAQQAVKHYPTAGEVLAWRAGQLVAQDPTQAIQLYSLALRQNAVPYDWWLGLGQAYLKRGDERAALLAYEQGCALAWGVLPCHELQQLRQKMQAP